MDVLNDVIKVKLPERTNFVLMCTDEDGSRTDTIIVGCYNSVTKSVDLISIPRDTMITVSDEHFQQMQEEYPEPGNAEMQINHVHHFIGEKDGPAVLTNELERLLDIQIDYYVRVDFNAFRYFVDSVGGLEFDVPCDMDYDDPTQDLAIHLKAGLQTLDGEKAEQVVRFRHNNNGTGYANGDIGRIEVQQDFLKALFKKAVNSSTITSNPTAYINTFFKYITTNATLSDAIKYASAINDINVDNMSTYTLPGEAYARYYYDEEETERLVYNIFKRSSDEIIAEREAVENGTVPHDSKSAKIQVLNGGYTNGKASEVKDRLVADGYDVEDIGTYNEEKRTQTKIYVNEFGLGEDLVDYFADATVINDSTKTGDYDIVIVIGINE
jgi:LCP family protein required for cell wall assembly